MWCHDCVWCHDDCGVIMITCGVMMIACGVMMIACGVMMITCGVMMIACGVMMIVQLRRVWLCAGAEELGGGSEDPRYAFQSPVR